MIDFLSGVEAFSKSYSPAFNTLIFATGTIFALLQLRGLKKQAKSTVISNYWSQWIAIDQWIAEHPDLRPYFYAGENFTDVDEKNDPIKGARLRPTADMILDSFANLFFLSQSIRHEVEIKTFRKFIHWMYTSQPYFRTHVDRHIDWYSEEFGDFIRRKDWKPARILKP